MPTWTATATNDRDPSDTIRVTMESEQAPTREEMSYLVFAKLNERGPRLIPDSPRGVQPAQLLSINGYSLSDVSKMDGAAN